jgi:hypothetical protein
MMLNAVTLEGSCAAIVHMHWQRYGDCALWVHQPFAVVLVDTQIIGNDLKLVTRHSKHVVVVDTHEINWQAGPVGRQVQLLFGAGQMEPSTPKPFVS